MKRLLPYFYQHWNTGKERDFETGWDYFGARYYNPSIARWMNVDPMAEMYPAWTPYNYVANNPLQIIDINGECWATISNPLADGQRSTAWYEGCKKADLDAVGATQISTGSARYFTSIYGDESRAGVYKLLDGGIFMPIEQFNAMSDAQKSAALLQPEIEVSGERVEQIQSPNVFASDQVGADITGQVASVLDKTGAIAGGFSLFALGVSIGVSVTCLPCGAAWLATSATYGAYSTALTATSAGLYASSAYYANEAGNIEQRDAMIGNTINQGIGIGIWGLGKMKVYSTIAKPITRFSDKMNLRAPIIKEVGNQTKYQTPNGIVWRSIPKATAQGMVQKYMEGVSLRIERSSAVTEGVFGTGWDYHTWD